MTVTVKYALSSAGQRAAILAGRNASQTVTETMELTDPAFLEDLQIASDGSLSLDITYVAGVYSTDTRLQLDAPPASLAEVIYTWRNHKQAVQIRIDAKNAEERARRDKVAQEAEDKLIHDGPIVAPILDVLEADPSAALPERWTLDYSGLSGPAGGYYSLTEVQGTRLKAIREARYEAIDKAKAAAQAAKKAAREAIIAEHGGHFWQVEGGMCSFKGYDLWNVSQTRRWVGTFTQPKGIDTFLNSPRGEHVFDVSGLSAGDCIQGAGFDTNSRGKRRSETEWFGVVVRNDDTGLVVKMVDSRAKALQQARKAKAKGF